VQLRLVIAAIGMECMQEFSHDSGQTITSKAAKEERDLTLTECADVEALSGIGFHSMRHSFISRAAELGIPVSTIKDQVGHMSDEMTDHYIHIAEQAQRKAVEKMDTESRPFVDVLVDVSQQTPPASSKLLN
jgi:integrase